MKLSKIKPYKKNAKLHSAKQIKQVADSISKFGFNQPIVVDKDNVIVVGHGRYEAAKLLGLKEVPILEVDLTEKQAKAYRLADNKLNESDWDMELAIEELKDLSEELIELTGFELKEVNKKEWIDVEKVGLKEDFIIPPFSIWDTKQKFWQDRKRRWQDFYGDSRIGRDDDLLGSGLKTLADKTGKKKRDGSGLSGTSEFDPVVADICYRWFGIDGGHILDPFAGGCVRGVVGSVLGQKYTGIDLSKKQIAENKRKVKELSIDAKYILGNSLNIENIKKEEEKYDLIFSCPPYYDLEKYDDGEGDLSMLDNYEDFLKDYKEIIKKSVNNLRENRFAVFTVGNIRDKKGFYRNFVNDTILAFEEAGAKFYNDIILVNALATAPLRSRRPFEKSRKVTKVHQNILAFYKGDLKEVRQGIKNIPKVERYHKNIVVFYKGNINEIKENYKIINTELII